MNSHEFYMKRTLELAMGGWGKTNPNPLVGAVIVKDDRIVSEGFHEALGCAHAEADAISKVGCDIRGGTVYVNLEPCSHYGRTPPCAKALIEAGVKEAIIAMEDPNPKVAGRGINMLKDAGISVTVGVLEQEAKKLNEIFIKYITTDRPFVIMKTAMTLDGKIATHSGDSKWISGEESRLHVHTLRDRVAAIMVGVGTVLKDNPSLTTRLLNKKGRDPVRIIVDSRGRTPEECKAVMSESESAVIIATTSLMEEEKEKRLIERGATIIKANGTNGKIDLVRLMEELYNRELDSVLLEGGGTLNAAALEAGIVDKVLMFIAPKIIGGRDAFTPVEGEGASFMKDAIKLRNINAQRIGEDILIEGYI